MPTAHTVIGIYNGALDMITSRPTYLGEDRVELRWLNRNYATYVQSTLRKDLWNFATELHELNQGADPAYRWAHSYDLPNGWLRVIPPTYSGYRDGQPMPYEVKSNRLLTDTSENCRVELIMDRQDPGEWDPLFASLIIARLANGMAHAFTHKASFVQLTKQAMDDAYDDASTINAFESPHERAEQHDILRVRGRSW